MLTNEHHLIEPHAVFMGGYALEHKVEEEVCALLDDLHHVHPPIVTERDLEPQSAPQSAPLPVPVQKYLRRAGVIGKPRTLFAKMRLRGEFRRSRESAWMPTVSEQYNRIDQPARLWYATMRVAPLINFYVRDIYASGEGVMNARLTRWIPFMDERHPYITQGELMVVLNDMIFFPSALLSPNITWESVDDYSARATLHDHDLSVSALFVFNEQYDVIDFVANRYRDMGKKQYVQMEWHTPMRGHTEIHGVRVPTEGEVVWHPPGEAPLSYFRVKLVDVRHNDFSRYP